MKHRFVFGLLIGAIALISVSASQSRGISQGQSSRATAQYPKLQVGVPLNDRFASFQGSLPYWVVHLAFEKLVQFDKSGRLVPNLATSWKAETPTRLVFSLRRNVKFSDGGRFTSDDVVTSLNYWKRPDRVGFWYVNVDNIAARGPYTVVVTLKKPHAAGFQIFASLFAPIFSARHFRAHPDDFGQPGVLALGTGPWKWDVNTPGSGAELSANPRWWGGTAPYKNISVKFYANDVSMALGFRTGEIDVAWPGSPEVFAKTSGQQVRGVDSCFPSAVSMDVTSEPWSNIHVRRAVAYALDQKATIGAFGGYAAPSRLPLFTRSQLELIASKAQVSALEKSLPKFSYSIEKAKAEMAQTPYAKGVSVTLNTFYNVAYANVTQYIKGQLAQIGIDVKLNLPASGAEATAAQTGKRGTQGLGYLVNTCLMPDPSYNIGVLLGSWNNVVGAWNLANYAPPDVDQMIIAGYTSKTDAARFATYSKLIKRLMTDLPYVPLFTKSQTIAIRTGKFVMPNFGPFSYQNIWALDIRPTKKALAGG